MFPFEIASVQLRSRANPRLVQTPNLGIPWEAIRPRTRHQLPVELRGPCGAAKRRESDRSPPSIA